MKDIYAMHINSSDRSFESRFVCTVETTAYGTTGFAEARAKWAEAGYSAKAWAWANREMPQGQLPGEGLSGRLPYGHWRLEAMSGVPLLASAEEAQAKKLERERLERLAAEPKPVAEQDVLLHLAGEEPKPGFWKLWKERKEDVKKMGFFLGKENGVFLVRKGHKNIRRYRLRDTAGKLVCDCKWADFEKFCRENDVAGLVEDHEKDHKWTPPLFGTAEERAEKKLRNKEMARLNRGAAADERAQMDYRADRNDGLQFAANERLNEKMLAEQEAAGDNSENK